MQLFPDTHYLMQTPTRLLDERRNSTTQRGRVVPRRVLLTNLHLARRQMSLCNQNYLSIQEPLPRFCVFRFPFPLASSSLGLFSFFIQIPSRGIIKRETLVPREKERELRRPLIFRTPRGDLKLMQREVSGDSDNDRRSENKHRISIGTYGVF